MNRLSQAPLSAVYMSSFALVSAARADTTIAVGDICTGVLPYIVAAIGAVITFVVGWVLTLLKTRLALLSS
jgi:uncharacterized membrane protein